MAASRALPFPAASYMAPTAEPSPVTGFTARTIRPPTPGLVASNSLLEFDQYPPTDSENGRTASANPRTSPPSASPSSFSRRCIALMPLYWEMAAWGAGAVAGADAALAAALSRSALALYSASRAARAGSSGVSPIMRLAADTNPPSARRCGCVVDALFMRATRPPSASCWGNCASRRAAGGLLPYILEAFRGVLPVVSVCMALWPNPTGGAFHQLDRTNGGLRSRCLRCTLASGRAPKDCTKRPSDTAALFGSKVSASCLR